MQIHVIDRSGKSHTLDVNLPDTLESVISQAGISDEFGVCGGACACSSCQCYLSEANYATLGEPEDIEKEVIEDMAFESRSTSRLGCQLWLDEKMDGWTFTIAPY